MMKGTLTVQDDKTLQLSPEHGVFAVLTTTDSFIILLIQNRAHAAYAANAATAGAVDTA
ncbi:hypothetical protein DV515_00015077, partial [Chloebia gouldiae]